MADLNDDCFSSKLNILDKANEIKIINKEQQFNDNNIIDLEKTNENEAIKIQKADSVENTAGAVKFSVKQRKRNYRPRMIESSSSSDEEIDDHKKHYNLKPSVDDNSRLSTLLDVKEDCGKSSKNLTRVALDSNIEDNQHAEGGDSDHTIQNEFGDLLADINFIAADSPSNQQDAQDESAHINDDNIMDIDNEEINRDYQPLKETSNNSEKILNCENELPNSNVIELNENIDKVSLSAEPTSITSSTPVLANTSTFSGCQDPLPEPLSNLLRPETETSRPTERQRRQRFWNRFLNSDTSDSNEDDIESELNPKQTDEQKAKTEETVSEHLKTILGKFHPEHKWNIVKEISKRQYGSSAKCQASTLFVNGYYNSLHVPNRLKLAGRLKHHTGCVNALNFNDTGSVLCSASDDLDIAIWDWYKMKKEFVYHSGHKDNIFQCKFLNLPGNTHIVSCARDGQVRLAELNSTGLNKTRKIAKHSRSAHKLSLRTECPQEILSAGLDAVVFGIDIRIGAPEKLVVVKDISGSKVPLYGIQNHPLDKNQFCVAGQDEYVRVYDRRIISLFGPPVLKYCPNHLIGAKPVPNITAAVYSKNGDAIVASYNNDDIYLFDTSLSDGAPPVHRYSGHQNSSTVKGVNFFSPNSRFIVSGSDCGNIFIWDRHTEAIVNCLEGDDHGVVNVLEPHPNLPILATSGLDDDVKIWSPSSDNDPDFKDLEKTVKSNMHKRLDESTEETFGLDTNVLLMLMDTIGGRGALRRRRQARAREDVHDVEYEVDSSDSSQEIDSDDGVNVDQGIQCASQ